MYVYPIESGTLYPKYIILTHTYFQFKLHLQLQQLMTIVKHLQIIYLIKDDYGAAFKRIDTVIYVYINYDISI